MSTIAFARETVLFFGYYRNRQAAAAVIKLRGG